MTSAFFQSSVLASGFFGIANGTRITVPRHNDSHASTYYMDYSSTIQSRLDPDHDLPLTLRVYSPPHDIPLPDNTIVYAMGRAWMSANTRMIEAFIFEPIPGNPDDTDYEDRAPDVRHPVITILGQVEGHHEILPGDGWRAVFVKAFSLVCGEMRPSRVKCVLENPKHRWDKLTIPPPHSLVLVTGRCRHVCASGEVAIAVDDITVHLTSEHLEHLPNEDSTGNAVPTKRKRFNAHASTSHVTRPPSTSYAAQPLFEPHAPVVTAPGPPTAPTSGAPTSSSALSSISDNDAVTLPVGDSSSMSTPENTVHVRSSNRKGKGKGTA